MAASNPPYKCPVVVILHPDHSCSLATKPQPAGTGGGAAGALPGSGSKSDAKEVDGTVLVRDDSAMLPDG